MQVPLKMPLMERISSPLEVPVAEVDDGHGASDGAFELELASVPAREADQFSEAKSQGALVDGDDVLPALERVPDDLES